MTGKTLKQLAEIDNMPEVVRRAATLAIIVDLDATLARLLGAVERFVAVEKACEANASGEVQVLHNYCLNRLLLILDAAREGKDAG